ncbi:MAG: DUF5683 domain-containing protein [Brumimicrobium sp.]
MIKRAFTLGLFLLVINANLSAQENGQNEDILNFTEIDTLQIKEHSPKKAALLSLIPGGGQIYNHLAMPKGKKKAWWKVPIIYAGLGATGYFAVKNGVEAKTLKDEYTFRDKNGFPNPTLPEYHQYDQQGVLTLFEQSRTSRDLMIFAFAIVYGLNILDAYAEAHFVTFDVSEDLSMRIVPTFYDIRTPGIGLALNFK